MRLVALLFLVTIGWAARAAQGPGTACTHNVQCASHRCRPSPGMKHKHCHGPATQSQGGPCVDDGDCKSHTCGQNPRTDSPGGKRCL